MNTYLVIGAGPGIGLATAKRFATEGYRVVLAARSGNRIAQEVKTLRESGLQIETETVDASQPEAVADLVRRHSKDLAVLHYNAGVLHYDDNGQVQTRPLQSETVQTLLSDAKTNLVSALAAVQAAQPIMSTKGGGTILLTGGGFGVEPSADFIDISVAKAGLRATAKALFSPLKEQQIHIATVTVCAFVSPGSELTHKIADAFWSLHVQADSDSWEWEKTIS